MALDELFSSDRVLSPLSPEGRGAVEYLGRRKGTGGERKELDHGDAGRWAQMYPTATPVASQGGYWVTKVTAGPGASHSKQTSKSAHFRLHQDDCGHFLSIRRHVSAHRGPAPSLSQGCAYAATRQTPSPHCAGHS